MEMMEIAQRATRALDDKKAQDITVLKIEELTVISDYFVIASASSTTQLKAMADEVEYVLEQEGVHVLHTEGKDTASWILLDYGGVVVHLFMKDSRMFYSLERLWSDAKQMDITSWLKDE